MGFFTVKSKLKLAELPIGYKIEESDYSSLTPDGNFIQLQYHEGENDSKLRAEPGLFSIIKTSIGYDLKETSFVSDQILESFVNTKPVEDSISSFFNNIQAYYDHGIEVPKHSILLWGPPGTGKTTVLNKICRQHVKEQDTIVIVWNTDKFEASEVKSLMRNFDYSSKIKKIILVAEDLGGVEMDQVKFKSDSSLLSLLDNKEKTFTLPTLIISTTNFPEAFLGNLMNRPERFDDKIEVGFPPPEARKELLKFFSKQTPSEEALSLLGSKKCEKFTPAHIRQIVIRSATRNKSHLEIIEQILDEIKFYEAAFQKRNGLGM